MFLELIHGLFIILTQFRLFSTFGIIIYTYTGYDIHGAIPLLPFLFPFHLLGNPPCCDRIRPPWSQVADKRSPQWVSQVNGEGVRCSLWAPQVKGPAPCSSGYISPHTNPFCIVHQAQLYILMDRMEPLILGLPKSRTGTVARDFLPSVFFVNKHLPSLLGVS